MQMSLHQVQPEPTLSSLARETLRQCNGDVARAIKSLTDRILSDPTTLRSVIEDAVSAAVISNTNSALRHERAAVIRASAQPPAPTMNGAVIRAVLARNLLDFPLAPGMLLRDALKGDVLDQADRYQKQASDMDHKARWLRRVAAAVPAKKTVGQIMTAQRLKSIYDEVSVHGHD